MSDGQHVIGGGNRERLTTAADNPNNPRHITLELFSNHPFHPRTSRNKRKGIIEMTKINDRLTSLYLKATNAATDESGQGLVEYALIIAVVGVMLAASLVALRGG